MYIKELNCNVVEAAERRVYEAFQNNKTVAMSFSGGKDSICMSDIVIKTMQKYGISFARLMVIFFDEEEILGGDIVTLGQHGLVVVGHKFLADDRDGKAGDIVFHQLYVRFTHIFDTFHITLTHHVGIRFIERAFDLGAIIFVQFV